MRERVPFSEGAHDAFVLLAAILFIGCCAVFLITRRFVSRAHRRMKHLTSGD